jgi:nickel-dependent lactate racemase
LDSVRAVHRASVARGRVGPGIVQGNPFRSEIFEAAAMAGVDFSVQCCVNRAHSLTFVAAGGLDASVEGATRFAATHSRLSTAQPGDIVVVSGGGAPLDRTLYQAAKGWATGAAVVRRGGDLVLVAEMADGVGSSEFAALLDAGLETYERGTPRRGSGDAATGQWMLQHILQARARARLHVICSLPQERLRGIGVVPHDSVEKAVAALCGGNATRRVLALPHGPYCVPTVGNRLVTLEGAAAL